MKSMWSRQDLSAKTGLLMLALCAFAGLCSAHTALHPRVAKAMSTWAQDALAPPVFCGTLVKIAYDPTKIADASPAYFDNASGALIVACDNPMASRGKSLDQRVVCPPVQWTCGD